MLYIALLILLTIALMGFVTWKSFVDTNEPVYRNNEKNDPLKEVRPRYAAATNVELAEEIYSDKEEISAIGSVFAPAPAPVSKEASSSLPKEIKSVPMTTMPAREGTLPVTKVTLPEPEKIADPGKTASLEEYLREIELSENKLLSNLFNELQNQLAEAGAMLDRMNQSLQMAEMFYDMDNELKKLNATASCSPENVAEA